MVLKQGAGSTFFSLFATALCKLWQWSYFESSACSMYALHMRTISTVGSQLKSFSYIKLFTH